MDVSNFTIDGQPHGEQFWGVVDTGTSIITCPPLVCDAWLPKINVTADCSNLNSLPPVSFSINGNPFPLSANQYVVKLPNGDGTFSCESGIQSFSVGLPNLWILGALRAGGRDRG